MNRTVKDSINNIALNFMKNNNIPALEISITKNNNIDFINSFDLNEGINDSNSGQGIFMISSIMKTFTSFSIYLLYKKKLLSLEDKVITLLPYLNNCSNIDDNLKVINLLTHTGGINKTYYEWNNPKTKNNSYGILESFKKGVYNFSIDKKKFGKFHYSNIGYDILGAIIEEVTKQAYPDFIEQHISSPLGFKNSCFLCNENNVNLKKPTIFDNGEILPLEGIPNMQRHTASAVFFSTAEDLGQWGILHANTGTYKNNVFIDSSDYNQLWKSFVDTGIDYCPTYGLGWFIDNSHMGHTIIGHGGREYGYNTLFLVLPDYKVSVSILMNTQNADTIKFAYTLIKILENNGYIGSQI